MEKMPTMDKKNFLSNLFQFDVIKVNYFDGNYWLVPHFLQAVFSTSRAKWATVPYKSLKDLVERTNIIFQECSFSFNSDENFKHFNELMKIREFDFNLGPKDKETGTIRILKVDFLEIYFDDISIKYIKKGISPFYSEFFFQKISKINKNSNNTIKKIIWRNKKFENYE